MPISVNTPSTRAWVASIMWAPVETNVAFGKAAAAMAPNRGAYELPGMQMLAEPKKLAASKISEDALEQNARLLEEERRDPLRIVAIDGVGNMVEIAPMAGCFHRNDVHGWQRSHCNHFFMRCLRASECQLGR